MVAFWVVTELAAIVVGAPAPSVIDPDVAETSPVEVNWIV
jgi:hypothetical protein